MVQCCVLEQVIFTFMTVNFVDCDVKIRDVNEYSNVRIFTFHTNIPAISGFEYSHNFLTCNIVLYQFKGGLKFKAKGRKII